MATPRDPWNLCPPGGGGGDGGVRRHGDADPILGIAGYLEPGEPRAGCRLIPRVKSTVITAALGQNTFSDAWEIWVHEAHFKNT